MHEESLKRLNEMKTLKYNWNGYGAEPIPIDIIEKTEKFIRQLNSEVEIFPTANQTIQIEKENNFGYLEIEIYEDMISLFFASNYRKEIIEKEVNEREAFEFIDKFMSMSH